MYFLGGAIVSCAWVDQVEISGETMGTTYSVKFYGGDVTADIVHQQIKDYLKDFNNIFSTYIPDSEISLINKERDEIKLEGISITPEFQKVLNRALTIAIKSRGFFDPTIYPLVSLWRDHFKKGNDGLLDEDDIFEAKSRIGHERVKLSPGHITLDSGMQIDLSAIAKGSGVDGVASILEEQGIENYLVEIGGEIRVNGLNRNGKPWKVLILSLVSDNKKADLNEKDGDYSSSSKSLILSLEEGAVATSGDYYSYFIHNGIKYSHLIDPHTGMPIRHFVTSVSVIANTCEEADGWATALIAMGEKGIAFSEENNIPAIFMVRSNEDEDITVIKNSWADSYFK